MRAILGQRLFIGVSGASLTDDEKKFIVENNIGGITLFGRNCIEPQQIFELCREIQSLRAKTRDRLPLFIGIDQEGGRVTRLTAPFTKFPAPKILGLKDSTQTAFEFGLRMGTEMFSVGVNLNYAPCLDVLTNPNNPAIGDRAIGSDPELVSRIGSALARGYMKAGLMTSAKHFPGHGNTKVDSHYELPVETKTLDELRALEIIPFQKAFRTKVEFLMTAHILFPEIDPEWPATLSEKFSKTLIRDELGFRGFLISDDLGMKALANRYPIEEIPLRGLQIGLDFLLYCNEPQSPGIAMNALEKAVNDEKLDRDDLMRRYEQIQLFKMKNLLPAVELFESKPFDISKMGFEENQAFVKSLTAL